MEKRKSIKKNFILNSILSVTTILVPLLTFPYISRVLLVEANGKVNFASAVINYFILFSALGIPTYGIRVCATIRDDKKKLSRVVHELVFINTIMTAITYAVFILCLFFIPKFYQEKELLLITSINLLLNVAGMNWLYSALEEYKYITIRSLIIKFISVILVFTLLHSPKDYKLYAAILVVSTVGANVFNLIHSRKFVTYRWLGDYQIKKHLKPIFVFFATTLAISVYANLDTVMLGFVSGDVEVGYYSAASRIRTTVATLAISLGTVLLPRLSYLANNEKMEQFKGMLRKSFEFMFLMAVPLTLYFVVYAKPVVLLLSGDAFEGAVIPMQLLIPTVFFAGLSNVTGTQTMVPLGKENKLLVSIMCGAVIDFLLNMIFIPRYGSSGAAFATLTAEIVVLIVQIIYIKDLVKEISIEKFVIRPIIISVISILVSRFITSKLIYNLSNWNEILISGTVFGSIYIIGLIVSKEELVMDSLKKIKRS